jgi:hypothetical protein
VCGWTCSMDKRKYPLSAALVCRPGHVSPGSR